MNDAELIEGCKAGKREALETIYKLFSRQMYGVCCRYVGEESALDVMHAVSYTHLTLPTTPYV